MPYRTARDPIHGIMITSLIAAFVALAFLPSHGFAAEIWVEAWRHETTRPLSGIAVGDLTGDGEVEVVALIEESVTVYAMADEGPRFLAAIEGIPERPTAVSVYPYEGDGPLDVWIGTQSPGIIYVYRYEPESRSFRRLERIRYAWADVRRVIPLNLDGWGYADVAVVTDQNELVLFRWTPDGHQRVSLGELERGIRFVEARDVVGDPREELIIARGANHLAVLAWQDHPEPFSPTQDEMEDVDHLLMEGMSLPQELGRGELVKVWENYVWGTHLSLLVDEFRRGRTPEIVAVTSQKVAHHFAASDDGFTPVRLPVDWPSVAGGLIGTSDIDEDGVAEIVEAIPTGLGVWSISTQMNREATIELSKPPVFAFSYVPESKRMVVAGNWGFSLLRKENANFVKVVNRGALKVLDRPPLFVDGMAYLSGDDWADLLGMRLRYDQESGRISGLRGFHFLIGRVGERQWIYDGRPKEIQSVPFFQDDVLYLGADFASILGVNVIWEPFTRTLVVDP